MSLKEFGLMLLLAVAAICLIFDDMVVAQSQMPTDQVEHSFEPGIRDLDYDTKDSMFSLYQPYLENISAYKPIYFLIGAEPWESKFQMV
jgi:hypothetical protein